MTMTPETFEWELRKIYGSPASRPQLVTAPPTPEATAAAQSAAALELTDLDTTGCLRMPWADLDEVMGPILPWHFWVLAAATGNGKTLTIMNLVAQWIGQDRRIWLLPLEQPTDVMRLYLAALRNGLEVRHVIAGDWHLLPPGSKEAVQADLRWQATPDAAALLHMSDRHFVDEAGLREEILAAKEWGAEVVVVDHLHRLQMTGHKDTHQSLVRICQLIKELAKQHRIPILCAAQLNRSDGTRMANYLPPKATTIQGGEVIRQECDAALGLFRPLSEALSTADKTAVEQGARDIRQHLEPHCIGLAVLKHRVYGDSLNRVVKLRYDRGQLGNPSEDQRRKWVADQEGIRL